MWRNRNSQSVTSFNYRTTNCINLRKPSCLKVCIYRCSSFWRIKRCISYTFNHLFFIKLKPHSFSYLHCLFYKSNCHIPCIFICCDKSDWNLKNSCKSTKWNISKQLVPYKLLDIIINVCIKSTRVKTDLNFIKHMLWIFNKHTDIGLALAASSYISITKDCSIIFCCTYDNSFLRNKFQDNVFVACTILKSHYICVISDYSLILHKCCSWI